MTVVVYLKLLQVDGDLLFSLPHDLCGVGSDSNEEVIEAPKTKAAVQCSAVEFVVLCIVNALNKCVDC